MCVITNLPCISCRHFRVLGRGTGYSELRESLGSSIEAVYFCEKEIGKLERLPVFPTTRALVIRKVDGGEVMFEKTEQLIEAGCSMKEV